MDGHVQKPTHLARELTRIFNSFNKHSIQLKKNLKETNLFFREIRQNYSNACASAINSDAASLEAGKNQHLHFSIWVVECIWRSSPIFKFPLTLSLSHFISLTLSIYINIYQLIISVINWHVYLFIAHLFGLLIYFSRNLSLTLYVTVLTFLYVYLFIDPFWSPYTRLTNVMGFINSVYSFLVSVMTFWNCIFVKCVSSIIENPCIYISIHSIFRIFSLNLLTGKIMLVLEQN